MKKNILCRFILPAILVIIPMCLQAVTIKIGTIAPLRSPWIKELKKLDAKWREITDGQVSIKLYPGGILGSEEAMVRKMRMGALGGAVFTNRGINLIYPDSYVLNIPFLLESEEELDFLLSKLKPTFEKGIQDNGFQMITWAKAGWVYFYSKNPVRYPEDLQKHKISFSTGASEMEQAWKQSGFHIVPNDLKDMMMGLQSGMVDAFYLPPLLAASGQYFALAPNMCSMKIAPLVGGIILSEKTWQSIPIKYRADMVKVAKDMAENFYLETMKLEKEAMTEMKKHKLTVHQVPPDADAKWHAVSEKGIGALKGKAFSNEIYDQLMQLIKEYRTKK